MLLATTLVALGSTAAAQSPGANPAQDERVAAARVMVQEGRDEIIAEEMGLSAPEAGKFWPVYETYRSDMNVIRDRYATTLGRYLAAYDEGEISDEFARELLDEWLKFTQDSHKVRKDYVKKFEKVLPLRKVVRFYQLEDKMDAEIDAELAVVIPLMEAF
jgi:hypothetical protein